MRFNQNFSAEIVFLGNNRFVAEKIDKVGKNVVLVTIVFYISLSPAVPIAIIGL